MQTIIFTTTELKQNDLTGLSVGVSMINYYYNGVNFVLFFVFIDIWDSWCPDVAFLN